MKFTLLLPAIWFVAAVLAAALVVMLLYRRTSRPMPRPLLITLGALRWILLAGIAFCLFEPTWVRREPPLHKGSFAVVTDSSASMATADGPNGVSRLAEAEALLAQAKPALYRLGESLEIRRYTLDTHARPAPETPATNGPQTALLRSLAELAHGSSGAKPAGILLVSDGADNVASNRQNDVAQLAALGVPVFSAAVGGQGGTEDLEVTQFLLPWRSHADSPMPARVGISATSQTEREATLEVLQDNQPIASQKVVIPAGSSSRVVEMKVTPQGAGYVCFTARIAGDKPDVIPANDQRRRFALIEGKDRPRLLYVESHPSMEYKFLRRALESDPELRLSSILYAGADSTFRAGLGAHEMAAGLPERAEDYADFRAVILGDIKPADITPGQAKALETFVSKRGGGLLLLGGPLAFQSDGAHSAIEDLSPFLPVESKEAAFKLGGAYQIDLTPEGKANPALSALTAASDAQPLPELHSAGMVSGIKPGVETLLKWRSDQSEGPLIAVQRYGAGSVAAVATDELWRARMQLPASDNRYDALVRGIAQWLVGQERPRVMLTVDRDQLTPGQKVVAVAEAAGEDLEPLINSEATLTITGADGRTETIAMTPDLRLPGSYRADWTGTRAGEYELTATVAAKGGADNFAKCFVAVAADPSELKHSARDDALLRQIAEATGGAFFPRGTAPDIASLNAKLPALESNVIRTSAWDRPWVLIVLLVLLCGEWFLRRALRLP